MALLAQILYSLIHLQTLSKIHFNIITLSKPKYTKQSLVLSFRLKFYKNFSFALSATVSLSATPLPPVRY
jgi:hypothetical protein